MNKTNLIDTVSKSTNQSKATTAEIINSLIAIIQDAVANGTAVSIQGFISLQPINKKASSGSLDGKDWSKPEHQAIKLSAMKPFKQLVENGVQNEK